MKHNEGDPLPIRSGRPAKGSKEEAEIAQLDEAIWAIHCANPGYTYGQIHAELCRRMENSPIYDHAWDYSRGVQRAMKAFRDPKSSKYRGGDPEAIAQYRSYKWPRTHVQKALPWEATAIGLAIQATQEEPPTIRQIKWAHYLTLSAPNMPWVEELPGVVMSTRNEWNVMRLSVLLEAYELLMLQKPLTPLKGPQETHCPGLWYKSTAKGEERANFYEVVADYIAWKPWANEERFPEYISKSTVRTRGPVCFIHLGWFTEMEALEAQGLEGDKPPILLAMQHVIVPGLNMDPSLIREVDDIELEIGTDVIVRPGNATGTEKQL